MAPNQWYNRYTSVGEKYMVISRRLDGIWVNHLRKSQTTLIIFHK